MEVQMQIEVLAYSISEAVAATRISRATLYRAIANGLIPARKHGSRTLILANDLETWLSSLPVVKPRGKIGH
jgi:excisionase family DNA binding protein